MQTLQRQLLLRLRDEFLLALCDVCFGNVLSFLVVVCRDHHVARIRNTVQTEDLNRHGRRRFRNLFALIVDHCTDLAVGRSDGNGLADVERTLLYQYGSNRTAALVELGLDDKTARTTVRICLKLEHVCA